MATRCITHTECKKCHKVTSVLVNNKVTGTKVACVGCGAIRFAKAVSGVINLTHKCDTLCMQATSLVCKCSCGGENHGSIHSVK